MKRKLQFLIFNIGIFLIILQTSNAWFFWNVSPQIIVLIYILTLYGGIQVFKDWGDENKNRNHASFAVFFLVLSVIWQSNMTLLGIGYIVIYYLIIWIIISLPDNKKYEILNFQTTALASIIFVSLSAWVIHFFYPIPSLGLIQRPGFDSLYNNFLFYIAKYNYGIDIRFCSIFLEPGHLGTILVLFIMGNRFNYNKKEVRIFIVALLFSLSLAGYVLYVIGQLFVILSQENYSRSLRKLLSYIFLLGAFYIVVASYNEGNNYINNRIFNRIETSESEYLYGGDRTTDNMKMLYNRAMSDGTIVTGMSNTKYNETDDSSAGIIAFLMQKGIIGVVLLFMGYFMVARGSLNRKWAMLLFLFYVISSYQRVYFYWASYLIPYICGMVRISDLTSNRKK